MRSWFAEMTSWFTRRPGGRKPRRGPRPRPLCLEGLEDRLVPAGLQLLGGAASGTIEGRDAVTFATQNGNVTNSGTVGPLSFEYEGSGEGSQDGEGLEGNGTSLPGTYGIS